MSMCTRCWITFPAIAMAIFAGLAHSGEGDSTPSIETGRQAGNPPGISVQPPVEADLIDRILAAQKTIRHVVGSARRVTIPAPAPGEERGPGTAHEITFYLQPPRSYCIVLLEVGNADHKEIFRSDGRVRQHEETLVVGEPPTISRSPVDKEERRDLLDRLLDFVRLDRATLERDFTIAAQPATEPVLSQHTRYQVALSPLRALADDLRRVVVELDQDFRTVALSIRDGHDNDIQVVVQSIDYDSPPSPDLFTTKE